MKSFLQISPDSEFSMYNFPFGVFKLPEEPEKASRCATRLGNFVIDLAVLTSLNFLTLECEENPFKNPALNNFISLGKKSWTSIRE